MKNLLLTLFALLITLSVFSQRKSESYYRDLFAEKIGGITEFRLSDRTRVDILNYRYAIEADFSEKWAESIGQSLHYSNMTEKKAGILLIVDLENDERFITRLVNVSNKYNITVWILDYNTENIFLIENKYSYELIEFN
jgi:hypothetical protein